MTIKIEDFREIAGLTGDICKIVESEINGEPSCHVHAIDNIGVILIREETADVGGVL